MGNRNDRELEREKIRTKYTLLALRNAEATLSAIKNAAKEAIDYNKKNGYKVNKTVEEVKKKADRCLKNIERRRREYKDELQDTVCARNLMEFECNSGREN